MAIEYTKSKGIPRGTFEEEWLAHKRQAEWWYATGYGTDEDGNLYSYQFTLIKAWLTIKDYYQMQCAVTDIANHDHRIVFRGLKKAEIDVTPTLAAVGQEGRLEKVGDSFHVVMNEDNFSADLMLHPAKAPAWHCEDGILQMRLPKPKEKTYYYSYTNCPCEGTLAFGGKKVAIKGKGWIDKQGGTYTMTTPKTNWEWFSLRFFDDEEMMLFTFPKEPGLYETGYYDGTYIRKDGSYQRLMDYTLEPLEFLTAEGLKFACKWKLTVPGLKEGSYIITPATDGQLNLVYYELLARVENEAGELVGYSFVELLSGARNAKMLRNETKAGTKNAN